jgi:hypothetical protein
MAIKNPYDSFLLYSYTITLINSLLQGPFYDLRRLPNYDRRCSRRTRSPRYINTVAFSCCLSSLTLSLSLHGRWPNVSVSTESNSLKPYSIYRMSYVGPESTFISHTIITKVFVVVDII